MHRRVPLSRGEAEELRGEVERVLERRASFGQLTALNPECLCSVDSLYDFGAMQHADLLNQLSALAQFTFNLIDNHLLLWDELHRQDEQLAEMRGRVSEATECMLELREQNDQMRGRLRQNQSYIDWIEEEQECLSAIYQPATQSNLVKCASETSLGAGRTGRGGMGYEQIRDYVGMVREERDELERELGELESKYERVVQDNRRMGLVVDFMKERGERHKSRQSKTDGMKQMGQTWSHEDLWKILQNGDDVTNGSLKGMFGGFIVQNVYSYAYRSPKQQTVTTLSQQLKYQNPLKDASTNTELNFTVEAAVQTQEGQENEQCKIEIQIKGGNRQKQAQIAKILTDLQLQTSLKQQFIRQPSPAKRQPSPRKRQPSRPRMRSPTPNRKRNNTNALQNTYEFYHQLFVKNRIKKYRFDQPYKKPPNRPNRLD